MTRSTTYPLGTAARACSAGNDVTFGLKDCAAVLGRVALASARSSA